ncbi:uncharacterized protein FOMMEDRAFT_161265 [Fomitiporia mediterranea MF3/22]|uniref:uncharacterized protein n=1 Tax=Fomitiporia mediterranea (strain MF3/22) TaxID=694068 RepID=UPI00044099A3|nr:uncharacterized protein FOMMEDRAFT_161265 [Fomitiporia mediterranea MF3/22]EJC99045.1 hypothetical protein FOMMEDRAFT_161265 [Fomitiporia mediterranea MF3/22]
MSQTLYNRTYVLAILSAFPPHSIRLSISKVHGWFIFTTVFFAHCCSPADHLCTPPLDICHALSPWDRPVMGRGPLLPVSVQQESVYLTSLSAEPTRVLSSGVCSSPATVYISGRAMGLLTTSLGALTSNIGLKHHRFSPLHIFSLIRALRAATPQEYETASPYRLVNPDFGATVPCHDRTQPEPTVPVRYFTFKGRLTPHAVRTRRGSTPGIKVHNELVPRLAAHILDTAATRYHQDPCY